MVKDDQTAMFAAVKQSKRVNKTVAIHQGKGSEVLAYPGTRTQRNKPDQKREKKGEERKKNENKRKQNKQQDVVHRGRWCVLEKKNVMQDRKGKERLRLPEELLYVTPYSY